MTTRIRFLAVLSAAWLVLGVSVAEAQAPAAKLDAALLGASQPDTGATAAKRLPGGIGAKGQPVVRTILRFDGSLDAVKAQGGVVHSVIGNIATVDIAADRLLAVAALPSVVSIQASAPQALRLDRSVPATRADQLRTGTPGNWTGGTGRGVIVGILDDGLDFRHRDFRKADGTTRLLALWDQRETDVAGSPPAGYSYGGECTPAMINAAIAGNDAACTQPSSGGHGTHVGGIAAGNGQATGNGEIAYRMIGMAPDADILVVNSLAPGLGDSAKILDGLAWLKSRAAALGKPLVVNLSLGSYYGARDGTSNYEQGLDSLSGPGVILVGAAGNEANVALRAFGTITQGGSVTVGFTMPVGADGLPPPGQLELWYPGTNAYGISIACPLSGRTATVNPGTTSAVDLPCGRVEIASTLTQPNNDDRQITVGLTPSTPGLWSLTLTGTTVAGGSQAFSIISGNDATSITFTDHIAPVTTEILTDVVSARRVVGVAAYTTRYSWSGLAGPVNNVNMFGPLNDIADFSSRGPRRNCSNAAKCPAVMKPEIAAPGAMIGAALASDFGAVDTTPPTRFEADGVHWFQYGTSMATPHVTGAVALLLQVNPALTPEAVKAALFKSVQSNAFSTGLPIYSAATPNQPANPNYTWGYGILDAAAAVRSLQPAVGTPVTVVEFYNASLDHYFVTYVADEIAKLDNGTFVGWARTGQTFKAYGTTQSGTSAVCRIYIPPSKGNGHFFGRDKGECDGTMNANPTFILESPNFFYLYLPNLGNCAAGTVPVYRVFTNRADANHRYTESRATRDQMVAKGWIAEGDGADTVTMCAPQ